MLRVCAALLIEHIYVHISGAFIACTCCTHRRLRNVRKIVGNYYNLIYAQFSLMYLRPSFRIPLSLSLFFLPLFPTWPSLAWPLLLVFFFFFALLTCHVMRPFCGLGANSCCKFGHKNKFYLAIYFLFDPGMPGLRLCDEILTKLKGNICRYILRHAWRSSAS